jgi:hypothetical protein
MGVSAVRANPPGVTGSARPRNALTETGERLHIWKPCSGAAGANGAAYPPPDGAPQHMKKHEVPVALDNSAAALAAALRTFGDELGRALAEGIAHGVQEGLSRALDLDTLAQQLPKRAAEGVASSLQGRRRGGRPRGEVRGCRVPGCTDPARSRGLCSRHYQQELRREKASAAGPSSEPAPAPAPAVEARPPIIRKRVEVAEPPAPIPADAAPVAPLAPEAPAPLPVEESRPSANDLAKRIFGGL